MSPAHPTDGVTMTFDDLRQAALAQGYDELLERVWAPDPTVPLHQHDPDVWVRVVVR